VTGGTVNVTGSIAGPGTLSVTGGTLSAAGAATIANFAQSGGTVSGAGTLTLSGVATFGQSSSTSYLQSGSGTTDLAGTSTLVNGTLFLDGGRVLQNDGTFTWTGGAFTPGFNPFGSSAGGGTIQNDVGATFNDAFAGQINKGSGTDAFNNAGTFETTFATGTTTISVAFNNTGTVQAQSGTLNLNGGTLSNSGNLWADGGNLTVTGAVTGTGTGEITRSATLELSAAVASGQTINFDVGSTGTLRLDNSQLFSGTVAGLALNGTNSLDLSDISYGNNTKASFSETTAGGALQVTDGTHTANINLLGNYTTSTFVTASDGHGGTLIHDPNDAVAQLVQSIASFAPSESAVATATLLPPPEIQQTLLGQPHA
jgi:hypothetical protein